MTTCENCLFYVDTFPHEVICIGHKRIKSYAKIQTNCKKWVKSTKENAAKWLNEHKEDEK